MVGSKGRTMDPNTCYSHRINREGDSQYPHRGDAMVRRLDVVSGWRTIGISIVLLTALLPIAGSLPAEKTPSDNSDMPHKGDAFIHERVAKSVLRHGARKRVKRGWSINSLNLLWEMEEQQRKGDVLTHKKQERLAKVCPTTCWGRFGGWSTCSVKCGAAGVQFAHRNITPSAECAAWVKQHGCPGSSMIGRPCNRKCYNGGTLQKNDCACPDAFNGTCCESFMSCGDPGAPPYGYLENFDFVYDSVVHYGCRYGYQMFGASRRRCQADGTWTGNMPICSVVTCPRPTRLDNGWIELRNGSAFGSEASYACVTGYFLRGHRKRVCQHSGVWSGPEARCVDIFCPLLSVPFAGLLRLPGAKNGVTPFGGVAIYSCNYTHTIRGDRLRRCQGPGPIGLWSGHAPTCIEKTRCPPPKLPGATMNTQLHCSADIDIGGEHCSVVCEPGFSRVKDEQENIECNEDTNFKWVRPNDSLPLMPCHEVMTPQISLQAEAPYSVKNCAALQPQERSLLRAEFSHILAVHDICMQNIPGHDGCHVISVESRCSDWLSQNSGSEKISSASLLASRGSPHSGLVARELIMAFNLTVSVRSLHEIECAHFCSNTSTVCTTEACLDAYVVTSTSLLIDNVEKLKELSRKEAAEEKAAAAEEADANNDDDDDDETDEDSPSYILVNDKPTMAAGRYILFAKDSIKIRDINFRCDAKTSVGRKYCERIGG